MYSRKELYVPFSGRRYIATNTGKLLNSNRNELIRYPSREIGYGDFDLLGTFKLDYYEQVL